MFHSNLSKGLKTSSGDTKHLTALRPSFANCLICLLFTYTILSLEMKGCLILGVSEKGATTCDWPLWTMTACNYYFGEMLRGMFKKNKTHLVYAGC